MAVLQARVSDEMKAGWSALARRSGVGASELLRQVITSVLANNPRSKPEPAAEAARAGEPEAGEGSRIRLQFREHELEAISTAAGKLGWRRNTWVLNVVRTALFQEPRPTAVELQALQRSTSELLAIGRNLNQIAHAMHKDDRYKSSVTVEKLDTLRDAVAKHAQATVDLLEAAERRWRPPESFRPETTEATR